MKKLWNDLDAFEKIATVAIVIMLLGIFVQNTIDPGFGLLVMFVFLIGYPIAVMTGMIYDTVQAKKKNANRIARRERYYKL